MFPHVLRAGEWFLRSGIQFANGGVARYYRADVERNQPVSTEITGYAASALVYLHALTGEAPYLERAVDAARFLARQAWDSGKGAMPFEVEPAEFSYFFDCGIIVRGLLAVWRASGENEFRAVATEVGRRMAADFISEGGDFHPVLALPGKTPLERDSKRWSRSSACYQLKSAMAWWDLFEATGDAAFREFYERALEFSLRQAPEFLPGHADPLKVMDRLHAFAYFLEGLLPCAGELRSAMALADGIAQVQGLVAEIGARFLRSDVCAQLLRIRLYADWQGAAPLDREAACREADVLAGFQAQSTDARVDGGFYFGRKGDEWVPHVSPVSGAFALQALALWECRSQGVQPHRHLLI